MKTCRPMAELFFARLSPELRLFAIRKLGRFAAETSLASMHEEVKTLASAAARGDAAATVEHVLLPLVRQLESELPSIQSAKSGHLSKVCSARHQTSWQHIKLVSPRAGSSWALYCVCCISSCGHAALSCIVAPPSPVCAELAGACHGLAPDF